MKMASPHPTNEKILAFLVGELTPAEGEAVSEHCRNCALCRQLLASLSATQEKLATDSPAEPLRPLWPDVHDRLERDRISFLRPAFAMKTAVALVFGIALGLLAGSGSDKVVESEGSYLWSVISSTDTVEDWDSLPDIYATTSGEGS